MFENEGDPDGVPLSKEGPSPADLKDANQLPPKSGLYHTSKPVGALFYKKALNESVIKNAGAYIVLGTDRPASDREGYGAWGSDGAASIDLVVGRMSSANKGEGPKDPSWVDPSFSADAARIHISELTDIDHNFGLAKAADDQSVGRSGIAIKADNIRVIGRGGIKLISGVGQGYAGFGKKGETLSKGGNIYQPSPEISFIAGNSAEDRVVWGGLFNSKERIRGLQPLCLGHVTRDALLEITDMIQQLSSAVLMLAMIQETFNAVLGIDPLREWVVAGSIAANTAGLTFINDNIWQQIINTILFQFNYLYSFGYKYICSRNVKTT